jgi:hypothetical protein
MSWSGMRMSRNWWMSALLSMSHGWECLCLKDADIENSLLHCAKIDIRCGGKCARRVNEVSARSDVEVFFGDEVDSQARAGKRKVL